MVQVAFFVGQCLPRLTLSYFTSWTLTDFCMLAAVCFGTNYLTPILRYPTTLFPHTPPPALARSCSLASCRRRLGHRRMMFEGISYRLPGSPVSHEGFVWLILSSLPSVQHFPVDRSSPWPTMRSVCRVSISFPNISCLIGTSTSVFLLRDVVRMLSSFEQRRDVSIFANPMLNQYSVGRWVRIRGTSHCRDLPTTSPG
jgi:hypothetical protein